MGLFSKIGEMFRRMKTPKLEAGNNIQNQYNNTNNYMQNSYTMRVSNDGEEIMITSIEYENEAQHSNGEKTNIMIAKLYSYQNGNVICANSQKNIVFEIPQGMPIDETILQKIGQYYMYERNMPDSNPDCMYIGKLSSDPYDLSINNKSNAIQKYVNEKILPEVIEKKQEQYKKQIESYQERIQREDIRQQEFKRKMQEDYMKYEQEENKKKAERIANPYLKQNGEVYLANDGKNYRDYDGINVNNGEILRLRQVNKVGKDENGTYLYTGYINTTPNENDVEMISKNKRADGMPICFATDKKIEQIIENTNKQELQELLAFLSNAEEKTQDNGYLNYIGAIGKNEITSTIENAVENLQKEFYQKEIQQEKER
mgnify:FL=1